MICIVGDGETQEGQVWEACQLAARLELGNLVVLLDHNGAQSECLPLPRPNILQPEAIFQAAGWTVHPIDGRHFVIPQVPDLPVCVLVHGEKPNPHSLGQRSPLVEAYREALRSPGGRRPNPASRLAQWSRSAATAIAPRLAIGVTC